MKMAVIFKETEAQPKSDRHKPAQHISYLVCFITVSYGSECKNTVF